MACRAFSPAAKQFLAALRLLATIQDSQDQRPRFLLDEIHGEIGPLDDRPLNAADFAGEAIGIPFYPPDGLVVFIEDVGASVGTPSQVVGDGVFQVLLDLGKGLDRLAVHLARSFRMSSACGTGVDLPAR